MAEVQQHGNTFEDIIIKRFTGKSKKEYDALKGNGGYTSSMDIIEGLLSDKNRSIKTAKGNKVDCMIVDLDKTKRKVGLSIRELEKHNEKLAIEKYGKDGSSSGAVLGDILGKVFSSKKKKEKK